MIYRKYRFKIFRHENFSNYGIKLLFATCMHKLLNLDFVDPGNVQSLNRYSSVGCNVEGYVLSGQKFMYLL